MHLRRFLIYDADTGAIVHVHTESAALGTSLDEVLTMVRGRGGHLKVIEQSGAEFSAEPLRVEASEVRKADAGSPMAGGGVGGRDSALRTRRQYSRAP